MVVKQRKIDTLIQDIYDLLAATNTEMVLDEAKLESLGKRMAAHVWQEVKDPDRSERAPNEVYVTQLTSNCPRRRWYEHHKDKDTTLPKEKITGQNRFKFVYGDLIEEAVLHFAELAGHTVEYRQERLEMLMQRGADTYKIVGRIDAIIDGVLVDVKSMESFSFDRFKGGTYDDKWGYGNQLYCYRSMLSNDKRYPTVKDSMIFAINKLNGRMHLGHMPPTAGFDISSALLDCVNKSKKAVVANQQTDARGGTVSLDTMCAYCPFKVDCYQNRGGIQVYAYSEGPRFIVAGETTKAPKVPEITEAWLKETHG